MSNNAIAPSTQSIPNVPSGSAEQPLLTTRTHPKILFGPIVLAVIILAAQVAALIWVRFETGYEVIDQWGTLILQAVLVIAMIVWVGVPLLRWRFTTFTLTNRRVVERWGILYRRSREIPLNRIVSVSTDQGILDRIFRCGTLVFHDAAAPFQHTNSGNPLTRRTGGEQGVGIRFYDIPNIDHVRRLVDEAREEVAPATGQYSLR